MTIMILTQKELGITIEHGVTDIEHARAVERVWRYKYGKMFFRCEISFSGPSLKGRKNRMARKIKNLKTGEIYKNCAVAADDLNMSRQGVYAQCNRSYKGIKDNFEYIVAFA